MVRYEFSATLQSSMIEVVPGEEGRNNWHDGLASTVGKESSKNNTRKIKQSDFRTQFILKKKWKKIIQRGKEDLPQEK